MMKVARALAFAGAMILAVFPAQAQQFPSGYVQGNAGASAAVPRATSVSDLLDRVWGSTQGFVPYRGASGWTAAAAGATSGVQPYDANLAAIAGATTAANKLWYWTGSATGALTDLSAFARTVLDDADSNTALTTYTATRAETGAVAGSVLSKLHGGYINVKTDFGAAGDGVSDDTAEIQAALDVVKVNGGTLYIPDGNYLISSLDATASVVSFRIQGDGATGGTATAGTVLYCTEQSGTARPCLDMTGSSYAEVSNVTIRAYEIGTSYTAPSVVPTAGFLLASSGTLLNCNKMVMRNSATDGFFSVAALGIGSCVNNIYVGGQYINQAVGGTPIYIGTANGKTWNTHHADGSSNVAVTNENLFFGVEAHARYLDTTGTAPTIEINTADTILWFGMPLSNSGATASYIKASGTITNCRFEPAKYYSEGGGDPVHLLDLQDGATMTRCHFAGYDFSGVTGTAFNGGTGATAVDCTIIGFDDASFTGNIISGFSAFGPVTAINGASIDTSYPPKLQVGGNALLTSTGPSLAFKKTDADTDEKYWDWIAGDGAFSLRAANDAFNSASNAIQVSRSGTTISGISFPSSGIGVGKAALSSAWSAMPASTTAKAHLNLVAGVAPTAPNDGDIWFDGSAFNVRISGVTRSFASPPVGDHTIWIPASAMIARTSNGCAAGSTETTTNKVMIKSLDCDASADEFAQFQIAMPKSWDEGTITATFYWTHGSTTTNFGVVWGIQCVSLSNDDAFDTAFGTVQTATDTGGTTNDVYVSPATSAVTCAGTPAEGDLTAFQVYRDADNGSDTMAVDAKLVGVKVIYTTNAANDD